MLLLLLLLLLLPWLPSDWRWIRVLCLVSVVLPGFYEKFIGSLPIFDRWLLACSKSFYLFLNPN